MEHDGMQGVTPRMRKIGLFKIKMKQPETGKCCISEHHKYRPPEIVLFYMALYLARPLHFSYTSKIDNNNQ